MATIRQCHYILHKPKSNVHTKAILWSVCFSVPLRQINNSNVKVKKMASLMNQAGVK